MTTKEKHEAEEMMFDTRTVGRRMRAGALAEQDYEAYLKTIPDSAANAEELEVFEEKPPEDLTPHVNDELTFT